VLKASLALSDSNAPRIDYLFDELLDARPEDVLVIGELLAPHQSELADRLRQEIEMPTQRSHLLRAAATLALFAPNDPGWDKWSAEIAHELVTAPAFESKTWTDCLRPVGGRLVRDLESIFADRRPQWTNERSLAAAALAEYVADEPKHLVKLALLADSDREFLPLVDKLRAYQAQTSGLLEVELNQIVPDDATNDEQEARWRKHANAAVSLVQLGQGDKVWPLMRHSSNPTLQSYLIQRFFRLGTPLRVLADRLELEDDVSARQALILSLGEFDALRILAGEKDPLVAKLWDMYRNHPDRGLHSAAQWTLQMWDRLEPLSQRDADDRDWYINSQGQTMLIFRRSDCFEISAQEVTVQQYQKFRKDQIPQEEYAPVGDCPMNRVSWYDAAAYCNWLSKLEGFSECYEPNEKGEYGPGMKIRADWGQRDGYRLPTEEEWGFVCQADSVTQFSCGDPLELLPRYGWYVENSRDESGQMRSWPVGRLRPNAFGTFDMHGNAWEWCHDAYENASSEGEISVTNDVRRALRGGSFQDRSLNLGTNLGYGSIPDERATSFGFRLARKSGQIALSPRN
jgi:formylglycine-generating enzyme required for sulfatase activity